MIPCAELSGYRNTESGESESTGFKTWTGPDGEVTRDPRIGCTYSRLIGHGDNADLIPGMSVLGQG